ncbi:MAG: GlsB/YeaQ/YmgE family stress response membrane protein [Chloroflexota bacterium]
MSRNNIGTLAIYALAIVGLIVVGPFLLSLFGGLLSLAVTLVLWMFAGALAGRFMRGEGYGPIGDIGLGIVGGIFGTFLVNLIGLGGILAIPFIGPILVGAIGAVVFIFIARLFNSNFAR